MLGHKEFINLDKVTIHSRLPVFIYLIFIGAILKFYMFFKVHFFSAVL